jgi:hypothetical protein
MLERLEGTECVNFSPQISDLPAHKSAVSAVFFMIFFEMGIKPRLLHRDDAHSLY